MNAVIVAKGPTATYLKKKQWTNTLLIGINQACKLIDKPDFVFMNDIESLKGLTAEDVKDVKCFVIPEYPHINLKPNIHLTKKDFLNKLSELDYTGNVETFNYYTTPNSVPSLLTTNSDCITTVHTAIFYMSKVYNIQRFRTFGFLISNRNEYHNETFYEYQKQFSKNEIRDLYASKYEQHLGCLNRIIETLNINVTRV